MAGNSNSGRKQEKPFRDALRMELAALSDEDPKALRSIAKKLLEKAADGDIAAMKELFDRVDGKVPQAVVGDDESDAINVVHTIERRLVRANAGD